MLDAILGATGIGQALNLANLGSAFLNATGLGGLLDIFTRIAGNGAGLNFASQVGQGVLDRVMGQSGPSEYGQMPTPEGVGAEEAQGLLEGLGQILEGILEILTGNVAGGLQGIMEALMQLLRDKLLEEGEEQSGAGAGGGATEGAGEGGEGGGEAAGGAEGSGGGRPANAGGWGDLRNHPMVVLFSRGVDEWNSGLERVANADPSTPEGMNEIFLGQAEMNRGQNAMTAASNTLKAIHSTIQAITQNIPRQNS